MLRKTIIFVFILLLVVSSDFDKYVAGFRFFKYLIIVPSLLLVSSTKGTIILTPIARTYIFLFSNSVVLFLLGVHQSVNIEELIIYLGIIIVASSNFLSKVGSSTIFLSLLSYFIIIILIDGVDINLAGIVLGDFSSIESNIIAFICPILFLFYLTQNKNKNKVSVYVNYVFSLLSIKRITMIAMVLIVVFKKYVIKYKNIGIVLTSFLTIALVILVSDVSIRDSVSDYLNISLGLLTMGRSTYYTYLIEGVNWNVLNLIFGYGIGHPQNILEASLGVRFLIHNDWLKLFIEHGVIGFLGFIYLMRRLDPVILITLSIWMITDNIIVYFPVIILIQWYDLQKNSIN